MALDSRQKRMSALNPACPWRGPLEDAPEAGVSQGNRQAMAFMYSGILAGAVAAGGPEDLLDQIKYRLGVSPVEFQSYTDHHGSGSAFHRVITVVLSGLYPKELIWH